LPPSLDAAQNFSKGANFAVVGATALSLSYFQERNITSVPPFNSSLSVQLDWFEDLKPPLCNTTRGGCEDHLGNSLFVLGEFGGNDYVFLLAANKALQETRSYVPAGVERLIGHGARHIVVPGNLPTGCTPIMLTLYARTTTSTAASGSSTTGWRATTTCFSSARSSTRTPRSSPPTTTAPSSRSCRNRHNSSVA
jgi:phospholipase/lecithinase/hemolysin